MNNHAQEQVLTLAITKNRFSERTILSTCHPLWSTTMPSMVEMRVVQVQHILGSVNRGKRERSETHARTSLNKL